MSPETEAEYRHGRLSQHDGRWQLTFYRHLPHPPEKVWRALTEAEHLAAWFPTRIDGDRTQGAALRFVFPNREGPTLEGEMTIFQTPKVLEFTWGPDIVRFELEPLRAGTRLTLVHTFDEQEKATRDAEGWRQVLNRLDECLLQMG